jgi:hypothetical protein
MLPSRLKHLVVAPLAVFLMVSVPAHPQSTQNDNFEALQKNAKQTYDKQIVPFIKTYCSECHGEKKRKGDITFQYAFKTPGAANFRKLWQDSVANVKAGDMPPEKAGKQPTADERAAFAEAVSTLKYLSPKDPGTFVPRRLTRTEYGNTLRDVFKVPPSLAKDLPDEVLGAGYLNSISPLLVEQYLAIAKAVVAKTPIISQLRQQAVQKNASVRDTITSLARLAYRRPPSTEETDVLLQVHQLAIDKKQSPENALQLVAKAILVSPQFLFVTPTANEEPANAIIPLDDHHLASRLSYFLWASPPDAELAKLADQGTLHEPAQIAIQVRRMIKDPRSRALFDGFGAQWLGLNKLAGKTFDSAKFPVMVPELRSAMYDEARLLFEEILRENQEIIRLIDNDHTFLNASLASIYGIKDPVAGKEMRKFSLPTKTRGGILTMPGVLATTSFPDRTSPVNRGVWVLEQILGEHVPPAPPNVPNLEKQDQSKVATLTLRQRTELHRSDPVCNNCHKILDPIGFGLENFDAIGRWRDVDESGGPINASGELPNGQRFTSPIELKNIIAKRSPDLTRNLTGKLLAYALGRQLEGYDEIVADQIASTLSTEEPRLQTLVVQIATSYPFTYRRTKP